jgi:hypothetical protein
MSIYTIKAKTGTVVIGTDTFTTTPQDINTITCLSEESNRAILYSNVKNDDLQILENGSLLINGLPIVSRYIQFTIDGSFTNMFQ